jgi:putative transposase
MPYYRRSKIGQTYFFTVVTDSRAKILTLPHSITALRFAFKATREIMPFTIDAIVILKDHLHAIWTLPEDDVGYSKRWGFLKKTFTQQYLALGGIEQNIGVSKQSKRERGIWQRRFWEHTITTDERYATLMDYIHYNPVKHGFVTCPMDYEFSSFKRSVEKGLYPSDWGCVRSGLLEFDVSDLVGE